MEHQGKDMGMTHGIAALCQPWTSCHCISGCQAGGNLHMGDPGLLVERESLDTAAGQGLPGEGGAKVVGGCRDPAASPNACDSEKGIAGCCAPGLLENDGGGPTVCAGDSGRRVAGAA
mmetsp:Transcript_4522/g.13322  ORF Transcript_4522/g.13322 Transcript_4522/m.13322 type:complete len:118 (+) Transcript_4522:778-1131(+)